MLMGSLIIISGCILYLLLKPPVPQYSLFKKEEVIYAKDSSLDGGVAGCLTSQPNTR